MEYCVKRVWPTESRDWEWVGLSPSPSAAAESFAQERNLPLNTRLVVVENKFLGQTSSFSVSGVEPYTVASLSPDKGEKSTANSNEGKQDAESTGSGNEGKQDVGFITESGEILSSRLRSMIPLLVSALIIWLAPEYTDSGRRFIGSGIWFFVSIAGCIGSFLWATADGNRNIQGVSLVLGIMALFIYFN